LPLAMTGPPVFPHKAGHVRVGSPPYGFGIGMTDIVGALHFLVLIGLTGAWLEHRIRSWPQWMAFVAFLMLVAITFLYAGAVAIGYGAM